MSAPAGPRSRRASRVLVGLQLLAIALACIPFGPQRGGVPALALIGLGAALGVAALGSNRPGNFSIYPELRRHARLVTTGPYRLIRHPMYAGLVLVAFGVAAYNGHWLNGLALGLLMLVLGVKAGREEQHLVERFPEYADYARRTARFVPFLW